MTPPQREFFTSLVSMLRGAFFARYAGGEERDAGLPIAHGKPSRDGHSGTCSAAADASHAAVMGETVEGAQQDSNLLLTIEVTV